MPRPPASVKADALRSELGQRIKSKKQRKPSPKKGDNRENRDNRDNRGFGD